MSAAAVEPVEAPEELPPRPDATGALVPVRYIHKRFGTGGLQFNCQMLQIGAVTAPNAAETAYTDALKAVAAFMDAERLRWKTSCPPREAAFKHAMNAEWLLKHAREAETREERCHHAWYWARILGHTTHNLFGRREGAYTALAAVGSVRRAGALAPAVRRAQLVALIDGLIAAREAAYPLAWADAIEPLFSGH